MFFGGGLTSSSRAWLWGAERGRTPCGRGEESVVPVRTEGRALVPPIRGGAGARAVVEKGAGRTRAKCPRLRPRPFSPPRGWGLGLHRFGPAGFAGGEGGLPRAAFRARRRGGVKPVFPRLRGIRLAGRRVRGCDATPPPRPRRGFRLLGSEAAPGKARCCVWPGLGSPCVPRPASLWVGGALADGEQWRFSDFMLWLFSLFCRGHRDPEL